MSPSRTYLCQATPAGEGGIHVILLAGPDAWAILRRRFEPRRRRSGAPSLQLGKFAAGADTLDEILLARLPSLRPAGGQVFEINTHGGVAAKDGVIDALRAAGAIRISWPRFQARFGAPTPLRRRLDLLQARAATARAALWWSAAAEPTVGALAALSERLRAVAGGADRGEAERVLQRLEAFTPISRALYRPPRIALCGPPNAGKSTLFNRLTGRDRVIVDDHPGTTRDRVEGGWNVQGVPFRLVDAAGMRDRPGDALEAAGVRLAWASAREADIRVFLFDGAREVRDEEVSTFTTLPEPKLAVVSKADLAEAARSLERAGALAPQPALMISVHGGQGVGTLSRSLLDLLNIAFPAPQDPLIPGGRIEAALRETGEALETGDAGALEALARAFRKWTR